MNITGRQQAPLDHLREKPQRQGVAAAEAALPSCPHRHRPFFAAHRESPPMLVNTSRLLLVVAPTPHVAHGTSGCAKDVPLKQWKKA